MVRSRWLLPALVGAIAIQVVLLEAQLLPSKSQPIAASRDDSYMVVQEDGTTTFSSGSTAYSVVIPKILRGDSYQILGRFSATVHDVVVVKGSSLFVIRCTNKSSSCDQVHTAVSLPFSTTNPKSLAIQLFSGFPKVVTIASEDTIVTFDVESMRLISNKSWTVENHFKLNHVSSMEHSDQHYTVVLGNRDQQGDPGVVVRVACDELGRFDIHDVPVITYMELAPMNFRLGDVKPSGTYWSQIDTKGILGEKQKAFISSFSDAGFIHRPVTPLMTPGQTISPSFIGEFSGSAVMAVGNIHVMGWDIVCLRFDFDARRGKPAVIISEQRKYRHSTGMPFLGAQIASNVAVIQAVVKTPKGWEIAMISFDSCPHRLDTLSSTESNSSSSLQTTSVATSLQRTPLVDHCKPSSCSFARSGDCEHQCWSITTSGDFVCCTKPPV